MTDQRTLHIVQIGMDNSVFAAHTASDTRLRQKIYAAILAQHNPGSLWSMLTLVGNQTFTPLQEGNFRAIPVNGKGIIARWNLFRSILRLHRHWPIHVLSPQTIYDDGWIALIAGKVIGAKVIGQIHYDIFNREAITENLGRGLKGTLRHALGMRLLRRFTALRVVSNVTRNMILERGLHTDVRTIPVPVTMPPDITDEQASRVPQVLFIGRLVAQKNLYLWLRVARRVLDVLPQVKFAIAGDGPMRSTLQEYAQSLNLHNSLIFLGEVPYEELPPLYRRSSVFLLTSFYEGFGRVLVEANLQQLPVVATINAGSSDVIENGKTGILIDLQDEQGIAQAVIELLREPEKGRKLAISAKERSQQLFDPSQLAEEWVSFLVQNSDKQ